MTLLKIQQIVHTKMFVAVVSSALGAAGGAVVTHFALRKQLEEKYAKISDEEIAEARRFYRLQNKEEEYATPMDLARERGIPVETATDESDDDENRVEVALVKQSAKILREKEYIPYDQMSSQQSAVEKEAVVESIRHNVFDSEAPEDPGPEQFNISSEMRKRDDGRPYIISQDEFMENVDERDQPTLMYYEEDDVLAESPGDQVVPEIDRVIGTENLRFGYGSEDPNIVYVHNPILGVDYEIVRNTGSYAEIVLGASLRHSDRRPGVRKFRMNREDDD